MFLTGIIDEVTLRFGKGKTLKISTTNDGNLITTKLSVERDGRVFQKARAWTAEEFRCSLTREIDPNGELDF